MKYKTCNYKWIDFLSNRNVIKVTNEKEFEVFRNFLSQCGLLEVLQGEKKYSDWQNLAEINNKNKDIFLFEYDNFKGLTWSDDIQASIEYYDKNPIEISELNEFFEFKSYSKIIDSEEDIEYDIE